MRDFAKHIMACEAMGNKTSGSKAPADVRVCEKLRPHLATLMGNAGFRALLSRSLALASAEVPSLRAVQVNSDGCLEGLNQSEAQVDREETGESGVVLLAQLVGLLIEFIGEGLTLRLLRDVWPKLSLDDPDSGNGAKNEKRK
jgi:hypothetical protein